MPSSKILFFVSYCDPCWHQHSTLRQTNIPNLLFNLCQWFQTLQLPPATVLSYCKLWLIVGFLQSYFTTKTPADRLWAIRCSLERQNGKEAEDQVPIGSFVPWNTLAKRDIAGSRGVEPKNLEPGVRCGCREQNTEKKRDRMGTIVDTRESLPPSSMECIASSRQTRWGAETFPFLATAL